LFRRTSEGEKSIVRKISNLTSPIRAFCWSGRETDGVSTGAANRNSFWLAFLTYVVKVAARTIAPDYRFLKFKSRRYHFVLHEDVTAPLIFNIVKTMSLPSEGR
jgi:Na+-transporting NADH:ubiquinone oxidoreductase subunit NqrB